MLVVKNYGWSSLCKIINRCVHTEKKIKEAHTSTRDTRGHHIDFLLVTTDILTLEV